MNFELYGLLINVLTLYQEYKGFWGLLVIINCTIKSNDTKRPTTGTQNVSTDEDFKAIKGMSYVPRYETLTLNGDNRYIFSWFIFGTLYQHRKWSFKKSKEILFTVF